MNEQKPVDTEDEPEKGAPRPDLARVRAAKAESLDENRKEAVDKQHARGRRTARENIGAFLDPGSFVEYGNLARPARKDMTGPADGVVMGIGETDGHPVAVMSYDYTVYAGTQSAVNHPKTDRIFEVTRENRLPIVCWVEGGGARPHDMITDTQHPTKTFVGFAKLNGLVPTVGICSGPAFAGNANLAGLTDVLICTKDAVLGMAGPPLVEAALGKKLTPAEIGPVDVHVQSGVVDVLVEDDAEAIDVAKQYLSYFRGPGEPGTAPDVMRLRDLVPESPRRAYDVRAAIKGIADEGSILELKPKFGRAIVTALCKIDGRPVGVVANQPMILAGAIDSPASDKAARFIQLCDAHDIPMLVLCDTPGLMVGPEVEKTGLVRHSARVLTAFATASIPFFTVVLRKAYGLGYYVMGSLPLEPRMLLAWPTAEFGGMGLEGAVNIIHKQALEAFDDAEERARFHKEKTDELKFFNTALGVASRFGIDDVIDPAETRDILIKGLNALPDPAPRNGRKRVIDNF